MKRILILNIIAHTHRHINLPVIANNLHINLCVCVRFIYFKLILQNFFQIKNVFILNILKIMLFHNVVVVVAVDIFFPKD